MAGGTPALPGAAAPVVSTLVERRICSHRVYLFLPSYLFG